MIYDLIAPFYDRVNQSINPSDFVDFYEQNFTKWLKNKPELVLDLACGTGRITRELARRGYDMTGVDGSVEMLGRARDMAEKEGFGSEILWLLQDMTDFELYGTVDAVVSSLDSINHLSGHGELERTFALVHNYLNPDGLFLFDVNGKHKFETVYAENTYAMEEGKYFCVWENRYNPRSHLCDFYITVFERQKDGRYLRHEDVQRERMFPERALTRALETAGFEVLAAVSDFDFTPATDESDRIFIAARCKKPVPEEERDKG